ncbi:AAA family ATPase [Candidatus Woesearchaeota archaeon]|nr:AAA family ATPase [Candidatus Woesearchaeota archaeon]
MIVIGLTGTNCAGKGTIAEYLKNKSFYYESLSDIIREKLRGENKEINSDNLVAKGNELRERYGAGILADLMLEKIEDDNCKNYVVDSIRNVQEVNSLRKIPCFFLFDIDAPLEIRFNRLVSRNRKGDPKTLEEFIADEERQNNLNPLYQQIKACQELANVHILNDSTKEDFYPKIDSALNSLLPDIAERFKRPRWDETWMNIAKEIARRSNCIKRKVGAVIVKNNKYVSSGYNGTPMKNKNCYEGGCPRCTSFAKSGSAYGECLCEHAERNAIEQADDDEREGATLYINLAPCLDCSKGLINAGIKEVVYETPFPLEVRDKKLEEAGVKLRKFEK